MKCLLLGGIEPSLRVLCDVCVVVYFLNARSSLRESSDDISHKVCMTWGFAYEVYMHEQTSSRKFILRGASDTYYVVRVHMHMRIIVRIGIGIGIDIDIDIGIDIDIPLHTHTYHRTYTHMEVVLS
jgi:hypothetical protein